jgi:hypothetical protein
VLTFKPLGSALQPTGKYPNKIILTVDQLIWQGCKSQSWAHSIQWWVGEEIFQSKSEYWMLCSQSTKPSF